MKKPLDNGLCEFVIYCCCYVIQKHSPNGKGFAENCGGIGNKKSIGGGIEFFTSN
ncbi:hypothetical protein KAH81_10090 [bacterium]|nr:hypothetical protein [bacterium]